MSLKMKLTSTIIAFFLVLGLVIMGVMAAPSATVNLGGTITFQATNVYAKVTGKISGTNAETQPTLDDITIDDKTIDGDITTWSSQDLAFKDDGSEITIEVTIENLATDRKLYAYITDTKQNVANVNKTMKQGEAEYKDTELITLDSTTTKTTITLSMEIADKNTSLEAGSLYGYNIVLMDISGVPSYDSVEGLTIECNTTDKVASITGNSITRANSDVIIPAYVKSGDIVCAVTSIGESAFHFGSLTNITIPNTVISLGSSTFAFSDLTNLIIPKSITMIPEYMCQSCSSLETIVLPDNITLIGCNAFEECSIENITLPENLTVISSSVFFNCGNLSNITIPDGVTSIEGLAFHECTSLTTVNYKGTEAQWNALLENIGEENDYLKNAEINYDYQG